MTHVPPTIGFFNNKGGVGKTSLVYHVAWMLSEIGIRVVAADLDPQANLSSMFVSEERLEAIWELDPRPTIYGAVSPQFRGIGDIHQPGLEEIGDSLAMVVGDLELSRFEDDLSQSWSKCADGDERSFRVTSALARAISFAASAFRADVALIDVGPNLGALNRSALLACDHVVVPLGADLFSLQGLRNTGPTLRDWRRLWAERRSRSTASDLTLPEGLMRPAGYIVMRHSVTAGRPARAYGRWIERIPTRYRESMLDVPSSQTLPDGEDGNRIATLKDYRSLMPMAQEARKPMFLLRPADGAFGGHQRAVAECYSDFKAVTLEIMARCNIAGTD